MLECIEHKALNKSMLGYFRLVRLPNVFTAIADILAAFTIVNASQSESAGYGSLLALCGASAGLYLAGMAFNDVADRDEDARVRPNRPIPSKQVSLAGARLCGAGLMALGLMLSFSVGALSVYCALCLAAFILVYDFGLKGIVILGPVTLGFCRFFNMEMGLSAGNQHFIGFSAGHWQTQWAPSLAVGIYAAGLTAFSAQEEAGKQLRAIVIGWIFCGSGILLAGLCGAYLWAWIALGPLTALLMYLTLRLKRLGTPHAARDLVRAGVMGICVLDCGMILGFAGLAAWPFALLCVTLLIPGFLLAKRLAQKEA